MASIIRAQKYSLLFLILISLLYSCMEQAGMGFTGVLKGKITIGPLCPVETVPPSPDCLPTAQTYKTWATAIWNLNNTTKLATLNPSLDGNYSMVLPVGHYTINFDNPQIFHTGSNLPAEITILKSDTTVFNVTIDTGIR